MKNRKHRKFLVTLLMTLVIMMGTMGTSLPVLADSATVKANSVNLRNAPTKEGNNIIGSLNKGDKVEILDTVKDKDGNEWFEIQLSNGNVAYISKSMVTVGEAAEEQQQEQPAQQQQQQQQQQQPAQQGQQPAQQEQQPAQQQQQQPAQQQEQQPAQEQTPAEQTPAQETPAEQTVPEKTPEQIAAEQAAAEQAAAEEAAQSQTTIDEDRKAKTSAEDYDPTTDKEARYGIQFLENNDGTGQWYVYNYDTGSKVAISDLQHLAEQEKLAKDNAAKVSRMKTILIIMGVALIVLILLLAWYIFFNRSTPAQSRKAAEKRLRDREKDREDGLDYQDEGMADEEAEEEYVDDGYDAEGENPDEDGGDDFDDAPPAKKGAGIKGVFGNLFAGKKPKKDKKAKKAAEPEEEEYDDYDDLEDMGDDEGYYDDGEYEDEYADEDYQDEPAPRRSRRTLDDDDDDMNYDFVK